jgi:hypothetical protein
MVAFLAVYSTEPQHPALQVQSRLYTELHLQLEYKLHPNCIILQVCNVEQSLKPVAKWVL